MDSDTPAYPVRRIELPDGHWAELRLASIRDVRTFQEIPAEESSASRIQQIMAERFVASSLGDSLEDIPILWLPALSAGWLKSTEDDALPPASGRRSGKRSPASRRVSNRLPSG